MTPRELIQRAQLTAVKARSNAHEFEGVDVAAMLDPFLYGDGDLSLLTVSQRMLDGEPTPLDAYNLLVLADRSPGFWLMYAARWEEQPPEPAEYLREATMPPAG